MNKNYETDRPKDGIYEVSISLSETNANKANKNTFRKEVFKISKKEINDNEIKVKLIKVKIDEDKSIVVATLKIIEYRDNVIKDKEYKFLDI
jgi:hypothetical protein